MGWHLRLVFSQAAAPGADHPRYEGERHLRRDWHDRVQGPSDRAAAEAGPAMDMRWTLYRRRLVDSSQLASGAVTGDDWNVHGFVAPTDHGWYQFLRARPDITEVNFWRPGGVAFKAIAPGAPFFFKLKRQHNAIGGFGLFVRAERLPVWRAWDVFGQANGTRDEHDLLVRLDRLGGRDAQGLGRNRMIGCIAITEPVFFAPDEWVAVPSDWARNIVSGRTEELSRGEGLRMWSECLERAAARIDIAVEWAHDALDAQRAGKPVLITPRLGQSSFRLAVLDAYGQQCAVTTEHSLPVIDAAHIRPWAVGGTHSIPNGVPLRRDLHRLFDLGYVTITPNMQFAVSRRLRDDYANGRVYYELDGRQIRLPESDGLRPDSAVLAWHEGEVFLGR